MPSTETGKVGPELFHEISEFWSAQLNNEIFLRGRPDVVRGSREYFDIILASRQRYIYYLPRMIEYLGRVPCKNLLEVGCGMGTDALVFAQKGFKVTGIDLAPGHLILAQRLFELYGASGKFVEGNAEGLPFADGTFSAVYSFGVLHHTPNTSAAIREVHRVLEPGGRAALMLYNRWSLNNFAHWITGRGFENARQESGSGLDAPVTQRFCRREVDRMCSMFAQRQIQIAYLYGAGWGKVYDMTPRLVYRALSKFLGWHLVVYLGK